MCMQGQRWLTCRRFSDSTTGAAICHRFSFLVRVNCEGYQVTRKMVIDQGDNRCWYHPNKMQNHGEDCEDTRQTWFVYSQQGVDSRGCRAWVPKDPRVQNQAFSAAHHFDHAMKTLRCQQLHSWRSARIGVLRQSLLKRALWFFLETRWRIQSYPTYVLRLLWCGMGSSISTQGSIRLALPQVAMMDCSYPQT